MSTRHPTSKKFISLFLVFSLLMLSANLYAKKRGAELTITKKDGHLIRGELIAVKDHSLLLLSATDVSIDIGDIKVIEIEKKSKLGKGALYGLLICGVGGALFGGIIHREEEGITFLGSVLIGTVLFAPAGALVGAIIGAAAGTGKRTFQIERMSDLEINEVLAKLRKKARIRDYK